ncbi:hypothetical protein [Paracidovorax avenae]|uniref:hypothetical protein n=1 Tax=Paracidovorax avenae TaxID=80867 RepID=UPI000D206B8E|nr:hypothetical protein [Paracidovorax avenae]AVS81776.1 hypothetical protein C8237_12240 [Paracidovorax avenae]AVS85455.1 hypothetical protein C8239_12405 [Paracidovorax avenae]AVS96302.1 hypothetical protein C8232_08580 [Paracidovorax avenae]AVT03139.1 hypothetical protein C8243_12030 [Paracidovorax avenae]
MKILWAIFWGSLFAAAAYFGMFHGFAAWYGPRYIRSDNDIGDLILISLGVCCLAFLLGGWVGYRLYGHTRRQSSSREHSRQGDQ